MTAFETASFISTAQGLLLIQTKKAADVMLKAQRLLLNKISER
jgi:hypothetical protein